MLNNNTGYKANYICECLTNVLCGDLKFNFASAKETA